MSTEQPPLNFEASWIYAIDGTLNFSLLLVLAFFIVWDKNLRNDKISIIYMANIVYDALLTLGFMIAGFYRLYLYYGECGLCTAYGFTPWACFNRLHAYLWIIFTPATGLIVLVSSMERFFSITFPLAHRQLSRKIIFLIVVVPLVASLPLLFVSGLQTYDMKDSLFVPVACNIINGDIPGLSNNLRSIRLGGSVLAVVIYIPILLKIYQIHKKQFHVKISMYEQTKLIRATITIGFFAANELCFFIFPDVYLYFSPKQRYTYIFYIIIMNKGVGNIVFLFLTQRDLRRSVLVRAKEMRTGRFELVDF